MGLSSTWQYVTCLMREWSSLCSRLKLMVSLRAALKSRTGMVTRPNVRCPFQTLAAICHPPWACDHTVRFLLYSKVDYDVNGRFERDLCPSTSTPRNAASRTRPNRLPR